MANRSTSLWISEELLSKTAAQAKREHRTVSRLVALLLEHYLNHVGKQDDSEMGNEAPQQEMPNPFL